MNNLFNFTENYKRIMSLNKNFEVVILSDEESKEIRLKDLLSKFYTFNIVQVCHHPAEAIECLNNNCPTIFFLDTAFADILFDVKKPPFIVGLCDAIHTKKVKQFLKMGFFDIFYTPYTEKEFNSIMGKLLNIYSAYNKVDQRMLQKVEEEALSYNMEDHHMKSVFIIGTRNEESKRIVFDQVLYMKKVGNQVCICLEDGERKYFHSNLKMFMMKFPKSTFQKINRSVVVNMDKVTGLIKNRVLIDNNVSFELSRSFRKAFKEKLPV